MQCVILAGGLGTRLGELTKTIPKNLIPVLGQPFAAHQLAWLSRCGVDSVVYSIGYKGEQIQEFVGDGSRFGLRVAWVSDGPVPLGTGGPLRASLDAGLLDESFCVVYGDSYLPLDLGELYRAFLAQDCPAMMSVLRNQGRWGRSNAAFADGRVTAYRKGPARADDPELDSIDYGATVLKREVLAALPAGPSAIETVYEELSDGGRLGAYPVTERFYEVGSPAGLAELEAYLQVSSVPSSSKS